MTYEKETLNLLRQSLDEEEDETSIISILGSHHKYLREYVNVFLNSNIESKDKIATARLFFPIFTMHAKAEEEVFYDTLKDATNEELKLDGLKAHDEHALAFELIEELKAMNCGLIWTQDIDTKIRALATMVQNHLKEEELILFPLAEKYIPESQLLNLSDDYLEKCKLYLEEAEEGVIPPEVSRSDVITLFY